MNLVWPFALFHVKFARRMCFDHRYVMNLYVFASVWNYGSGSRGFVCLWSAVEGRYEVSRFWCSLCVESLKRYLFKLFRALGFTPPSHFEVFTYDLELEHMVCFCVCAVLERLRGLRVNVFVFALFSSLYRLWLCFCRFPSHSNPSTPPPLPPLPLHAPSAPHPFPIHSTPIPHLLTHSPSAPHPFPTYSTSPPLPPLATSKMFGCGNSIPSWWICLMLWVGICDICWVMMLRRVRGGNAYCLKKKRDKVRIFVFFSHFKMIFQLLKFRFTMG